MCVCVTRFLSRQPNNKMNTNEAGNISQCGQCRLGWVFGSWSTDIVSLVGALGVVVFTEHWALLTGSVFVVCRYSTERICHFYSFSAGFLVFFRHKNAAKAQSSKTRKCRQKWIATSLSVNFRLYPRWSFLAVMWCVAQWTAVLCNLLLTTSIVATVLVRKRRETLYPELCLA